MRVRNILYGLLGGLILWPALSIGDGQASYRDGRLSVNFVDLELDQALKLTAAETEIEFSIKPGVVGVIDAQFYGLSLKAGIKRLLDGYNYAMVYRPSAEGPRLSRISVLGKTEPRQPLRVSAVSVPDLSTPTSKTAEVTLWRRNGGHFLINGSINGKPVEFLVDTGATSVALSGELANRIGLGYGRAKHIDTANGRTTGFETNLYKLSLGPLNLYNVQALILPGMEMGRRVLLGMNVLEAFDLEMNADKLVIRQSR